MNWFLTAKHWHLFALFIGLQILNNVIGHTGISNLIFGFAELGLLFGWYWSIGVVLNSRFDFTFNDLSFKIAFVGFILAGVFFRVANPTKEYLNEHVALFFSFAGVIILLFLYCILFCARALRAIELGGKGDLSDCWGHFFLLFCFPIGVWYLQARINKMYSGSFYEDFKPKEPQEATNPKTRRIVNMFVGFGILIFLVGHFVGVFVNNFFKILMPMGLIATSLGSLLFLLTTNLKREFQNLEQLEPFRYFFDKILLKSWAVIMLIWMFLENMI